MTFVSLFLVCPIDRSRRRVDRFVKGASKSTQTRQKQARRPPDCRQATPLAPGVVQHAAFGRDSHLTALCCAPNGSGIMTAERVMPLLNLGLQNMSLERSPVKPFTSSDAAAKSDTAPSERGRSRRSGGNSSNEGKGGGDDDAAAKVPAEMRRSARTQTTIRSLAGHCHRSTS